MLRQLPAGCPSVSRVQHRAGDRVVRHEAVKMTAVLRGIHKSLGPIASGSLEKEGFDLQGPVPAFHP